MTCGCCLRRCWQAAGEITRTRGKRVARYALVAALLIGGIATPALGTDFRWKGNCTPDVGPICPVRWRVATSWEPPGPPGAFDNIVFSATTPVQPVINSGDAADPFTQIIQQVIFRNTGQAYNLTGVSGSELWVSDAVIVENTVSADQEISVAFVVQQSPGTILDNWSTQRLVVSGPVSFRPFNDILTVQGSGLVEISGQGQS